MSDTYLDDVTIYSVGCFTCGWEEPATASRSDAETAVENHQCPDPDESGDHGA